MTKTKTSYLKVAAFQGHIKQGNAKYNLNTTLQQLEIAESQGADILCMPESFLHGYFESKQNAIKHSIDLESTDYAKSLDQFKKYTKTTLLLGLNERKGDNIHNTVVVIENGKHIGQNIFKAELDGGCTLFNIGKLCS